MIKAVYEEHVYDAHIYISRIFSTFSVLRVFPPLTSNPLDSLVQ